MTSDQLAATRPLRMGVVGLGRMGQSHLRCAQTMRGVIAVAGVDPREEARSAAQRMGIARTYRQVEDMLEAERLDGVVIASPEDKHLNPTLACLTHGIPVLLEKPVTVSPVEADRLARAERASGSFVLPGHLLRFVPAYQSAVHAVHAGGTGPVRWISTQRLRPYAEGAAYGNGHPAWVLLVHDIDLVLWVLGSEPVRVEAVGQRDPAQPRHTLVTAQLIFENGAVATMSAGWILSDTGPPMLDAFHIYGGDGGVSVDLPAGLYLWGPDGWSRPDMAYEGWTATGAFGGLRAEWEYFCACVAEGRRPTVVTLDDACRTVRTVARVMTALGRAKEGSRDDA